MYKERIIGNISSTKIFKLRLLTHFNGRSSGDCDSNDDDEFPHRLVADADYASFVDPSISREVKY